MNALERIETIKVKNIEPCFETKPEANPKDDKIVDVLVVWMEGVLNIFLAGWPTKLSNEDENITSTILKEHVLACNPAKEKPFYSYGRMFKAKGEDWEFNGFYHTSFIIESREEEEDAERIEFHWFCGHVAIENVYWPTKGFYKQLIGQAVAGDGTFNPFKNDLRFSTRTMKAAQKTLENLAEAGFVKWVLLTCNGLDEVKADVLFDDELGTSYIYDYAPYIQIIADYEHLLWKKGLWQIWKALNMIEIELRGKKLLTFYCIFGCSESTPDIGELAIIDAQGNIITEDELHKEETGKWRVVGVKKELSFSGDVDKDVWQEIVKEISNRNLLNRAIEKPNQGIRICVTKTRQEDAESLARR